MIYDVIIVGAGPAGSRLASLLAREGLEVLLLEKAELPRYKPCGGGVSYKGFALLEPDFFEITEDIINTLVLTYKSREPFRLTSPEPLIAMVMRDKFDFWLVKKAQEAGATVLAGQKATQVIMSDSGVKVITGKETFYGKLVVGADGPGGIVAGQLGLRKNKAFGLAIEGELEIPEEKLACYRGEVRLDLGCLPGGYGWVFPKKSHLSIGVGTFTSRASKLKEYFQNFLMGQGLKTWGKIIHIQGFLMPYNKGKPEVLSTDRGLLIGDAAGLADPFSGEGIYYALKSAYIAKKAILEYLCRGTSLADYDQNVAREMLMEFRRAYFLGKFMYGYPALSHKILSMNKEAALKMCQILRGAKLYQDIKPRHFVEAFLKIFRSQRHTQN